MKRYLFTLLALSLGSPALAQSQYPPLKVVIDGGNDGASCGVSRDGMQAAARAAMRYNRITEGQDDAGWLLYLNTNVLQTNVGCVAELRLEVKKVNFVQFGEKLMVGYHVACSDSHLITGSLVGKMPDHVKASFETCLSRVDDMHDFD